MRTYEYEKELKYIDQELGLEVGILLTFDYTPETNVVLTDISFNSKGILNLDAINDIHDMIQYEISFESKFYEQRNYQIYTDYTHEYEEEF